MDLLDILEGKYYQTHTGRYFRKLPEPLLLVKTGADLYNIEEGVDLDYEYVDPTSYRYKTLLNNVSYLSLKISQLAHHPHEQK